MNEDVFPIEDGDLPWSSRWWFQRYVTPIAGEMIQFDQHIFQMGGKNHQLVMLVYLYG